MIKQLDNLPCRPINQDGFTLLEVLIALLVLSIGLLGLAALQTVGLRSNQMGTMRTIAVQSVYDMTDRMRANPLGMGFTKDPVTSIRTYDAPDEYLIDISDLRTAAALIVDCDTNACSTTEMADYDLKQWRDRVESLPNGMSSIVLNAGDTHTVTIHWNESRLKLATPGTNCPPVSDNDLRCFQLTL